MGSTRAFEILHFWLRCHCWCHLPSSSLFQDTVQAGSRQDWCSDQQVAVSFGRTQLQLRAVCVEVSASGCKQQDPNTVEGAVAVETTLVWSQVAAFNWLWSLDQSLSPSGPHYAPLLNKSTHLDPFLHWMLWWKGIEHLSGRFPNSYNALSSG